MTGGALLALIGVWVVTQVLGGDALGRLGITGAPSDPGTSKVDGMQGSAHGKFVPGPGQPMPTTVQ